MIWNLVGHWVFGLPLGYVLCFPAGLGVVGLWWGLSAGLMVCGVALLIVWILEHARSSATDVRWSDLETKPTLAR